MSPNIFYTGATTNQQIVPGLDYLKEKGLTKIFLVGSDYVFPRTANKEIKAYAAANGIEILGEEYLQLGDTNVQGIVQKVLDAKPAGGVQHPQRRHQRRLLQGAEGQGQHPGQDPDDLGVDRRGGDRRRRRRQPGRPPGGVELLPDHRQPQEQGVRGRLQGRVRRRQAHRRPDRGRLQLGLHLEGGGREGRHLRRGRRDQGGRGPRARHARGHADGAPVEPPRLQDGPHRRGQRPGPHRRGVELGQPIDPDPCLDTYPWAAGLADGEARAECDAAKAS